MKYKEWFFEKKGFKRFLIIAMIIGAFLAVGWTRVNYDIYRLVVHEIVKAAGDGYITVSSPMRMATLEDKINAISGTSSVDLSASDGGIVTTSVASAGGTTPFEVQLPAITEALEGFVITLKNITGTSSYATYSAVTDQSTPPGSGYDTIEATQGTPSGVSYIALDAAGDVAEFWADYVSGSTNVWRMKSEDIS